MKYGLPQWMSEIWQIVNRARALMFSPMSFAPESSQKV
jgi:hypothetical protein